MNASNRSEAVLITGCSSGIGHATAEYLAGKGHTVYATARRLDSIRDLEASGCRLLALDVTDGASMAAAVKAVEDAEGAVGVLVNNAGYSQSGAVESVPMDAVRRQFETNVFGLVRMCQLALPGMRRQGWGRIINLSSMGGKVVFPGGGFYHGTKFAVEAISDALRFEVKGFGVGVTIIEPGLIKTEFGNGSRRLAGPGSERRPLRRLQQRGRRNHRGRLRGRRARALRRRARGGREGDRARDQEAEAAHSGHGLRSRS